MPEPRKEQESGGPDETEPPPAASAPENEAASSPALDRLNKALLRLNAKALALLGALDSRGKPKN